MKPKELRLHPDNVHLGQGAVDFNEWSLVRRWVRAWLKYYAWYAKQCYNPDASLDSWFDGPVIQTNWYAKDEDPELKKLGFIWIIFDLVYRYNQGEIKYPMALPFGRSDGQTIITGGITGKDFLIFASGIYQPKARRGVVVLGEILDTTPSNAIYQSE